MVDVPVVLLCGGQGIWIDGAPERVVKPLVTVAGRALVLHVIDKYAAAGARRFVLATGYQHAAVADLFGQGAHPTPWGDVDVRVVDTGADTPTGVRLAGVAPLVDDAALVALHYSDVLSDIDLHHVLRVHQAHQRLATVVGARVPTRFRVLGVRAGETTVRGFASRPVVQTSFINGGFYLFDRAVLAPPWLDDTVRHLEDDLLLRLARAGQLEMVPHDGAWQYLDSDRDRAVLEGLVEGPR